MVGNVRRNIAIVLILSALVPVLISGSALYTWLVTSREKQEAIYDMAVQQVKLSFIGYLQKADAYSESLTQSAELRDFLNSPEQVRPYVSNLLFGRISHIKRKVPEVDQWLITDPDGRVLFQYQEGSVLQDIIQEKSTGFFYYRDNDVISLRTPVMLDDQNFSGPASRIRGYIIFTFPMANLRQTIPNLLSIKHLPTDLEPDLTVIGIARRFSISFGSSAPYLAALGVTLFLSVGLGLWIVQRRILSPIAALTNEVMQKVEGGPTLDVTGEIDILKSAFRAYEEYAVRTQEELVRQSKLAAVSNLTQMFAHDVRKPFAILKMGLELLESAESPQRIKEIASRVLPEVQKSITAVNGMINDILEINSNKTPSTEPSSLYLFLKSTLNDVVLLYPHLDLDIEYDLQHKHRLGVDRLKIGRVIHNILSNAVQAAPPREKIWFVSREVTREGSPFVQITIGNSGSYIKDEDLAHLFESFYSKNKRGGTGLGLAIAHKLVSIHGGTIWCTSQKNLGVEFHFTLPVWIPYMDDNPCDLPPTTGVAHNLMLEQSRSAAKEKESVAVADIALETKICKLASELQQTANVLIVDDENVYCQMLSSHLKRNDELSNAVYVKTASDAKSAMELSEKNNFHLIIVDIDLGKNSIDGFELVKELRANNVSAFICMHSNRIASSVYKEAMSFGADSFLPKPLSRTHLLKLVLQAISQEDGAATNSVAIVDDSALVRLSWKSKLSDADVHLFSSPEDFWQHCRTDENFLSSLKYLIVDYVFDNSKEDGVGFARSVRAQRSALGIALSSSIDANHELFANIFDVILDKDALSFEELKTKFERAQLRRNLG